MKEMDILEIITEAGEAKNCYLQAIQEAKAGNYEACNEYVRNGNEAYAKAHRIHMEMVQQEAGGNRVELSILFTHAQDQLMNAEILKTLCDEFIDLYRRLEEMQA